jgi:hypothetical protein
LALIGKGLFANFNRELVVCGVGIKSEETETRTKASVASAFRTKGRRATGALTRTDVHKVAKSAPTYTMRSKVRTSWRRIAKIAPISGIVAIGTYRIPTSGDMIFNDSPTAPIAVVL